MSNDGSYHGVYPWQQAQWDACIARLHEGRLPHALLVQGETGVGVEDFARRLVGALLCEGEERPCGRCRSCVLYAGGNHPDFREITAEKEGGEIKVGQIRELLPFLQTSRHYDTFKIALIRNADAMNRSAANSLLKTLEEPPAGVVLVLISHHPFRLPATVRSRCQTVRLDYPDERQATAWLVETRGIKEDEAKRRLATCSHRPLPARDLDDADASRKEDFREDLNLLLMQRANLIEVAEKWQESSPEEVHPWLLEVVEEVVRREFGETGQGLSLRKLFSFYDRQKYRCLTSQVRLNQRLLLESALIEWRIVCATQPRA